MTNRIILITGGSRGLGRASALALADAGDDVVLTYLRSSAEADAVVAEIESRGRRAVALQLDTTDAASFADFAGRLREALASTWQRDSFDVLVNNAGYAGSTPFGGTTVESIQTLVDVHLIGVVMLTQELAPMISDGGRILNISTGLTRFPANGAYSIYAAVKGAIEIWTLYLAVELGARGIRVNVVAPGATATDFAGGAVRDNEQYQAMVVSTVALGRLGQPEDVGGAIAAVLDERMQWVTGQRIEASGGQRL